MDTWASAQEGTTMDEQIRQVLEQFGRLAGGVADLSETTDLYKAGLTSHASVNVMLALEEAFDVEFPQTMLRKSTFESIAAIRAAVGGLLSSVTR